MILASRFGVYSFAQTAGNQLELILEADSSERLLLAPGAASATRNPEYFPPSFLETSFAINNVRVTTDSAIWRIRHLV